MKAPRSGWTINGVDKTLRNKFVGLCKTHGVATAVAIHAIIRRENLLTVLFREWVVEEEARMRKERSN